MGHGMFGAAHVHIHLAPVIEGFLIRESVFIVRIHVPQKIPGRTGMRGHGVAVALLAGSKVDPVR